MKRFSLDLAAAVLIVMGGVCLIGGSPGAPSDAAPDRNFWEHLAHPEEKLCRAALKRGKVLFASGEKIHASHLRARTLEDALAAFQEALRADPESAESHFWVGRTQFELGRMEAAIRAFREARRLKRSFGKDDSPISFKLGIACSKLDRLEEASLVFEEVLRITTE